MCPRNVAKEYKRDRWHWFCNELGMTNANKTWRTSQHFGADNVQEALNDLSRRGWTIFSVLKVEKRNNEECFLIVAFH
jgi:hypothetical protein